MTHTIEYSGLDFEVLGSYEENDETTGYYGGWSTSKVFFRERNITAYLSNEQMRDINRIVEDLNY